MRVQAKEVRGNFVRGKDERQKHSVRPRTTSEVSNQRGNARNKIQHYTKQQTINAESSGDIVEGTEAGRVKQIKICEDSAKFLFHIIKKITESSKVFSSEDASFFVGELERLEIFRSDQDVLKYIASNVNGGNIKRPVVSSERVCSSPFIAQKLQEYAGSFKKIQSNKNRLDSPDGSYFENCTAKVLRIKILEILKRTSIVYMDVYNFAENG